MRKITLPQASRLTSPNPVSLVCTQKADGSTNLATVSWWTYVSFNPDMIAYAMAKTSFSGERVRETGEVILTIPGADLADAVMGCGSITGREIDKAQKFGIQLPQVENSAIQIPVQSRVAIHCRLKEFVEAGDHYLYICQVEQVYGDTAQEALFAWNGYSKLRPAR